VNAGELGRRGHRLDFLVAETFGEEQTSILMTADLWKKNISAYVGPQETCIHEGRMAAAFNIPMISYVSKLIFILWIHPSRFSEYYIHVRREAQLSCLSRTARSLDGFATSFTSP